MARGERPYRPGGFLLHPGVLGVVLGGVALWLGLFFGLGSRHGILGVVVAVVLVLLGLWLGYFVFMTLTVEAVGMTLWLVARTERKEGRPYRRGATDVRLLYVLTAPALVVALLLGFGFGYLAGGVFWGLYTGAAMAGFLALSEFLVAWR